MKLSNGKGIWNAAFNFDITEESDHYITFEVLNQDEDILGQANVPLKEVLRDGEYRSKTALTLGADRSTPRGLLSFQLSFVEQPDRIPDNVQVTLIKVENLTMRSVNSGKEEKVRSPYCEVFFEDDVLGKSRKAKPAADDAHHVWNDKVVGKYKGEQLLRVVVYDDSANYIGEANYDVWPILKEDGNDWFREGILILAAENDPMHIRGQLFLQIRFFDDVDESLLKNSAADASQLQVVGPAEDTADRHALNAQCDEADALAEQARAAANRAAQVKEAIDALPSAPLELVSAAKKGTEEAERAAEEALQHRDMVRSAGTALAAAPLVEKLRTLKDKAVRGELAAVKALNEAAIADAEQALKRARKAAKTSDYCADQIQLIGADSPHASDELVDLEQGARTDGRKADANADDIGQLLQKYKLNSRGGQAAEKSASDLGPAGPGTSPVIDSRDLIRSANALRDTAIGHEEDAEEKLRKARGWNKKQAKLAAKRAAKAAEREEARRLAALHAKEAARDKENDDAMTRRHKNLMQLGDVSEIAVYGGFTGTSYHNSHFSPANHSPGWLCCGSPTAFDADDEQSLYGRLPAHEVRGHYGKAAGSVHDAASSKHYSVGVGVDGRDHFVESGHYHVNRPVCWCFGCGCCRCCGEC